MLDLLALAICLYKLFVQNLPWFSILRWNLEIDTIWFQNFGLHFEFFFSISFEFESEFRDFEIEKGRNVSGKKTWKPQIHTTELPNSISILTPSTRRSKIYIYEFKDMDDQLCRSLLESTSLQIIHLKNWNPSYWMII